MKEKKDKNDFERIMWSDDLLDKILAYGAVAILSGMIFFIVYVFCKI